MKNLLVLIPLLLAPAVAHALGAVIADVRSTGSSTTVLEAGDQLTIDLRFENPERIPMIALGVVVLGVDADSNHAFDDGLRFVSSVSSETIFSQFHAGGRSFEGLSRVYGASVRSGIRVEDDVTIEVRPSAYVTAFGAGSIRPALGDGSLDVGVDGALVGDGDVHLRMTFEATEVDAVSDLMLDFGPNRLYGEVSGGVDESGRILEQPFRNATYAVRVTPAIPEPGAALLFGAGGLVAAVAGRRR